MLAVGSRLLVPLATDCWPLVPFGIGCWFHELFDVFVWFHRVLVIVRRGCWLLVACCWFHPWLATPWFHLSLALGSILCPLIPLVVGCWRCWSLAVGSNVIGCWFQWLIAMHWFRLSLAMGSLVIDKCLLPPLIVDHWFCWLLGAGSRWHLLLVVGFPGGIGEM